MNDNKNDKERLSFRKSSVETLSDDELAMLRAVREGELDRSTLPPHDNSELAQAKRYVKKNIVGVTFAVMTVILVIAVLAVLIAMLVKNISNAPSKDDFTVTLGDPRSTDCMEYTVPYKTAMKDDIFYLDVKRIADYADLVVSGGDGRIKLTCADGTYVRFENGSNTATVNGYRVFLGGEAKITDATAKAQSECWIPFSFIEKMFSNPTYNESPGIRTIFSDKDNSVLIRKVVYADGENEGEALPISFSHECFELAEEFTMRAYRQANPEIASAATKATMLINKNHPLGESYIPEGLFSLNETECPVVEGKDYELVSAAALSLTTMMRDMENTISPSEDILVTSAYRSYSYQEGIFSSYVADLVKDGYDTESALAEVLRTSARPGYSEHQSGLCVDLIEEGRISLDVSFENCEAFEWLAANCHKYGFILRYPKDKEDITGYSYEPWHYRFVGIDAATVIYEDGICLEEYLAKY